VTTSGFVARCIGWARKAGCPWSSAATVMESEMDIVAFAESSGGGSVSALDCFNRRVSGTTVETACCTSNSYSFELAFLGCFRQTP
jgi:hypothetical protein